MSGYGAHFADLVETGADIEGQARLADALVPRGATILDAGSGMGRVGAALRARGHDAWGVDLDADLIAQSRRTYPDFPASRLDLADLDGESLAGLGHPRQYDLVVLVGNVMIYLAPDSESAVLRRLAGVLAPGGRILVGFETRATKKNSRHYTTAEFGADVEAAGLRLQHLFGTYELAPVDVEAGDYTVAVLIPAPQGVDIGP